MMHDCKQLSFQSYKLSDVRFDVFYFFTIEPIGLIDSTFYFTFR